jgi:hypothetical protein
VSSVRAGVEQGRTLTIYRDDSTVQVVYERVKSVFWTAGNTVLVVSQYTNEQTGAHRYIHWPRERFCWFKDEPVVSEPMSPRRANARQG